MKIPDTLRQALRLVLLLSFLGVCGVTASQAASISTRVKLVESKTAANAKLLSRIETQLKGQDEKFTSQQLALDNLDRKVDGLQNQWQEWQASQQQKGKASTGSDPRYAFP